MRKKCNTCRFWDVGRDEESPVGSCRRHSPLPVVLCQTFNADDVLNSEATRFAIWPVTDESDWCGEWQDKDAELKATIQQAREQLESEGLL